ncbi:tetratricopeptide repeat protein [Streptomyces sp. H27-G5]|uniref:tetratricopeptide repeat protein n=1 Tax=Streptomyces sp. H27-G5 TaxID=2996698 RepID=UPI00226FE84D|nr:tetratricopeptide repeat protein [Streptomyces sp. H27-G5]MCY0918338.1 tetratricopeptide repeat protein [Streptomyces sp. H27-G5]
MSNLTPEEIRKALHENHLLPHGAARNAQAEALAAAAEVCGDRALFRNALVTLIDAYEYSSERTRMMVPFARLLQEYDRDPGTFDRGEAHSLFWRFKWISGQIINSPEIPLASAAGYLEDMERRYRLAGYSERAVRQSEYYLADAIGDDERAERAVAAWQATERDEMSDCHACETNSQGSFWATKGDDAKAIEIWEPVLAGKQTCREEPHRVLARSLLPMLRQGRIDEARAHHLRGYRLARGNESLLRSIGQHIEFCALTGNEARGLEILFDHDAHLKPLTDVKVQLDFHGGVLVLLERLATLGHGAGTSVPYEGSSHSVDELCAVLHAGCLDIARRFDARNGNSRVSDRFLARLGRAPLVDVLPLGVRSSALPQAAPVTVPTPPPVEAEPAHPAAPDASVRAGVDASAERARHARDQGHPGADALWSDLAVRVAALPASEADPLLAADLADHRAVSAARAGAPEAAELLVAARDHYRALGQAERAALAELRLAGVAAQAGADPAETRRLLSTAIRAAEALDPADPVRGRRIARAELTTIRLEPYLRSIEATHAHDESGHDTGHGHDHQHEQDHGHAELAAELDSFIASYAEALPEVAAEAEEMLGRVLLTQGDPERALSSLASSADRAVTAGCPWQAVDALVLRAGVLLSLGRPEEAEAAARSGLEHAAELTDPEEQGVVRLTLADTLLRRRDGAEEAAEHALTAAHWFDQAGLSADGGAQARLLLARAYARTERYADAAEVVQSTLPDLLEHGEQQAVFVREFLGDLLREVRDLPASAEQYLHAAELTKDWEDPRPQAGFAQAAADQLAGTELVREAVAAYERALELHRQAGGAPVAEARILRSLAWLALREEVTVDTTAAARSLMDEATGVLEAALAADPQDPELRAELAQTWHQSAQVLDRQVRTMKGADEENDEEGGAESAVSAVTVPGEAELTALRLEEIRLWDRAAVVYAELGHDHLEDRFQCINNAAWTEQELGRPEAGVERVTALMEEILALPEGVVPEWMLPNAERILARLRA